jgi:superfamily I DNA/RNA helicase
MSDFYQVNAPGPSPEQQKVIDLWGRGLAVMAGAGSGKTTTLVSKCMELLNRDSNARFAAVSFTERSASDLRAKLAENFARRGDPGAIHQHWVMTIHGLCSSIIREFPLEAGLDGEEKVLNESETELLWESVLDQLWWDDLPDDLAEALNSLLDRESQGGLSDLLKRLRELAPFGALDSLSAQQDLSSLALVKVGKFVFEKYSRLKRRRGSLDFNDLEISADRALEVAHVRDYFHRKFQLVLVDEFQDTNPLQARLIWKFARNGGSNLCVVGDPKQSIYRFRDADVTVFEEFCEQLPVQQSLTWNFRSRPGIIEFANSICGVAFEASRVPSDRGEGSGSGGMRFEALVPRREAHPVLEPVMKVRVHSPSDLAQWILSENKKGIPLHDMALLVRRIRGNEAWFKALSASGIPLAFGSGGLFWDDPRVRELVAFLRWWDHPSNSLSAAVFLRAPWMEISDSVIDRWVREDSSFRGPFLNSSHPVALRLKPFFGVPVRPGELLLALLSDEAREGELWAPLMGLWHRVEEYSSKGLDYHEIVGELSRAIDEKRRDREIPAPRHLGQLPVLTFHGAKGLEFPHVILIDFPAKSRGSDAPLLFWDRTEGAYLGGRDEDGQRDRKNPIELRWREAEKQKNLAESKRIFYVALTRARERLVMAILKTDGDALEPDRTSLFHEDHWRNWVEYSGVRVPEVEEGEVPEKTESQSMNQPELGRELDSVEPLTSGLFYFPQKVSKKRARHSVTEWSLLSQCPRSYEWSYLRPRGSASDQDESRQDLGTRVHQCLEQGRYEELNEIEKEVGVDHFEAEPLIRWARNSQWMAPEDLSRGREVWRELAFEVPFQNEVLVGSLDRLILEQKEGVYSYTLLDFKVGKKSKSPRLIIQSYSTQIQIYALAIQSLHLDLGLGGTAGTNFRIEPRVIHISPGSVREVVVPYVYQEAGDLVKRFVDLSSQLIDGREGGACPGGHCQVCPHQRICPDAVGSDSEQELNCAVLSEG